MIVLSVFALVAMASLAEKKEFVSFLTNSISIYPERKSAKICLSPKYLEMKKLAIGQNEKPFLSDGRGERI